MVNSWNSSMLNYVLSFRERLISRHNTLAQATDASCYCARWTPSFYQLPSSQANYQPHPPMFVSVKRTNIAFTSCYIKSKLYRLHFLCSMLRLTAFASFPSTDTLNKLTSVLVRGDVALLIVWHLPPPALVVSSFSKSRPPNSRP